MNNILSKNTNSFVPNNMYLSTLIPSPSAHSREDGLLAEPAGALELQQSEGVYSDCGAA